MALWTLLANHLADLELAKLADHPRPEQQTDGQRRQTRGGGAKRDVPRHVQHGELRVKRIEQVEQHQPRSAFSRSTTRSVRTPREPFTRTRSPALRRRHRRLRRLGAGREIAARRPSTVRPRPPHPPARQPARRRRRAAHRPSRRQPRGRPRRAAPSARSPSSSISPSTAIRRPPDALRGQHLDRASRRGGVGVVAVVDDRDAACEAARFRRGGPPAEALRRAPRSFRA